MFNQDSRRQSGFTLIELMIVVAIIGILAAIAVPAYQDYTRRTHVSEGINLGALVKTAISEYYLSENIWPTDNATVGIAPSNQMIGNAVKRISVNESVITVTYNAKVTDDSTVLFKGQVVGSSFIWTCNGGTVLAKYRPAACR